MCSVHVLNFCFRSFSYFGDFRASMEKLESFGESAIPWMDDDLSKASTSIPEVLVEENTIGTLIIIIVSAILSITLLFMMAVFIDCRHQKLAKIKQKRPRKVLKITIPKFNGTPSNDASEDRETFADKMHTQDSPPDSTPSAVAVIV